MGNKTCDLMKAGKTVLFAFEEAIGIVTFFVCGQHTGYCFLFPQWSVPRERMRSNLSLLVSVY